jgi:cell division protein FtsW
VAQQRVQTEATFRRHRPDYWLVALCIVLLAVGLVVVYSISPALSQAAHTSNSYYVTRQLIAIAISAVVFGITANVPLSRWRQLYKPLLIFAALATVVALVMPVNPNYPAHRWVRLGTLSFQSVELLKFAILVWLAGLLAASIKKGTIRNTRQTLQPVLIALGLIGVIVAGIQSDLGSTGVIVAMVGVMIFVAGMPIKKLLLIVAIIAGGTILLISSTPYRRERLITYLHPESSCQTTSGYQACQAIISVGSGGIIGLGLGRSVQAYGYLPEATNDSIFAIYAEKFGFIGSIILLLVFAAFFSRLKIIAERAPDDFSRLLVIGILTWLSVQAMINIGAMIGILPLKGITLPFISYGGTSVVFLAAAVGLAFQVSRYTTFVVPVSNAMKGSGNDNHRDRRRIGGTYHPDLGSRS